MITNIEQWRISVQLCKESTGQMPIQEDINTAFEKLINPVLKNVTGFEWKWKKTYCEQTANLSITMTDDQVHAYITSVMEVIHRLPKQLKWEVQNRRCRRLPQERNPRQAIKRRTLSQNKR